MIKPERNPLDTGRFQKIARTFSGDGLVTVDASTYDCSYDPRTKVIRIPANSEALPESEQDVVEGQVDHEMLHARAEHILEERRQRGEVVKLPSEVMAALPDAKRRQLFNVVKDIADECDGAQEYIGISQHLDALNLFGAKANQKALREGRMSPWRQVTVGAILKTRGLDISWLPEDAQALVAKLKPELNQAQFCREPEKQIELVHQIWEKIKAWAEDKPPEEEPDSKKDKSKSKKKEDEKGKSEGSSSGEDESEGEEKSEGDDGEGEGGDEDESGDTSMREGKDSGEDDGSGTSTGKDSGEDGDEDARGKGEMDAAARSAAKAALAAREDLDDLSKITVEAIKERSLKTTKSHRIHIPHPRAVANDKIIHMPPARTDQYLALINHIRPIIAALRAKLLTLLRVQEACRIEPDKEEGELDTSQLYRLFGDKPDRNIFYTEEQGRKLSVAVSLLRDFSGSMSGRIVLEQMACLAIVEALAQLNIVTEVIGFDNPETTAPYDETTMGIYNRFESFRFRIFKTFEERYQQTKLRFAGDAHALVGGNNSDAEAVMFAARRLAMRKEPRKILMVLSDGDPLADGNNGLLKQATIENVRKIRKAGIECVGVGLGTTSVDDIYPESFVIDEIDQLAPKLFKIMKMLLTRSSQPRR